MRMTQTRSGVAIRVRGFEHAHLVEVTPTPIAKEAGGAVGLPVRRFQAVGYKQGQWFYGNGASRRQAVARLKRAAA